ncbi:MAG: glycosyltransferase [Alphaproteobacteria bacterium]
MNAPMTQDVVKTDVKKPFLSVVVPVYNEEANLEELYKRLAAVLDQTGRSYEIILTNDGSKDKSSQILKRFFEERPQQIRVIEFNGNYGQHMAIMAGFELSEGAFVLTMDADLQNPPEEIPKLLELVDQGHDYVGSYRLLRHDSWFRTYASRLVNWIRGKVTQIQMRDHGCMLRAYSRAIVDAVVMSPETATLVPVLAYTFAANPTEVGIEHVARENDASKYNLYKLLRLNFDLFTGFSLVPLHVFTFFGMFVSFLSSLLVIYLLLRRLFLGPEAEGLFTLFAILFFLVSIVITGIGMLGEYIGRIYQIVRQRPRFLIREILKEIEEKP